MKTEFFKNEAISQSRKSTYKQKLGSVVVYKKKIVGRGFNKVLGTGNIRTDGFHAEIEALNNCSASYRDGSTVYVCRINKKEEIVMAKPCHACEVKMRKMGVKYVWYSRSGVWEKMIL